jgi:predicted nucleic acid-binding protein
VVARLHTACGDGATTRVAPTSSIFIALRDALELILDTNALSAFVDGDSEVGAILGAQHRAAIPVVVLGEFRYGIMGSRHQKIYEEWLETHLRHFDLLAITTETTVPYAALRATLKRLRRPIPANDVWIEALAIQHRLPILSRDKHFDALSHVRRIGW